VTITINDIQGLDEFRDLLLHCIDEKATCPDDYEIDARKSKSDLKSNIEKHGFLDSIKCWQDPDDPDHIYIIDGYTRMAIWHKIGEDVGVRGLKKKMVPEVEMVRGLRDRDAVKLWIIENQLGRRNLNSSQRSYLRGKRYEMQKKTHGGNRPPSQPIQPIATGQNDTLVENETATKIGKSENVSPSKVKRDARSTRQIDKIAETDSEFATQLKNKPIASKEELTKIAESADIEVAIEEFKAGKERKKKERHSVADLERLALKHMEQAKGYLLQLDQRVGRVAQNMDTQTFLHRAINHWNAYIRGKRE